MSRTVLNFVNFIRGCEPRRPKDLLLPVREELAADRKAGIKHTFLFQYDALLREDLVSKTRSLGCGLKSSVPLPNGSGSGGAADRAMTGTGTSIPVFRKPIPRRSAAG